MNTRSVGLVLHRVPRDSRDRGQSKGKKGTVSREGENGAGKEALHREELQVSDLELSILNFFWLF